MKDKAIVLAVAIVLYLMWARRSAVAATTKPGAGSSTGSQTASSTGSGISGAGNGGAGVPVVLPSASSTVAAGTSTAVGAVLNGGVGARSGVVRAIYTPFKAAGVAS